jgi:hypothetical protein
MDLGLQGKHAIVTAAAGASAKPSRGNWRAKGVDVAIVRATRRRSGGDGAGAGGRDEPAHRSPRGRRHQQGAGGPHGRRRRAATWRPAHPGQQRLRAGGSATATGPIETVVDEDLIEDFNVKYVGRCAVPAPSSRS